MNNELPTRNIIDHPCQSSYKLFIVIASRRLALLPNILCRLRHFFETRKVNALSKLLDGVAELATVLSFALFRSEPVLLILDQDAATATLFEPMTLHFLRTGEQVATVPAHHLDRHDLILPVRVANTENHCVRFFHPTYFLQHLSSLTVQVI